MIDKDALVQRCGGDIGLVRELLRDFLDRCDSEVETVQETPHLRRQAHRLKGLALNLGLGDLEVTAREVEEDAEQAEGSEELRSSLLQSLRMACESARKLLSELDGEGE